MTEQANTLTDDQLWDMVEAVDWPNNCREDSTVLKRALMLRYSRADLAQMDDFVRDRRDELVERLNGFPERVGRYGGDDSFHDMVSHVVGMGRVYFSHVINDPRLLNELEFTESFSYVIPWKDDFENVDENHWAEWAGELLGDLAGVEPGADQQIIGELTVRLKAMQRKDFAAATAGFEVRDTVHRSYNVKLYDRYYHWLGNPANALFANALSDCYQWMVAPAFDLEAAGRKVAKQEASKPAKESSAQPAMKPNAVDLEALHEGLKGYLFKPAPMTNITTGQLTGHAILTKSPQRGSDWQYAGDDQGPYWYEDEKACREDVDRLNRWSRRVRRAATAEPQM